MSAHDCTTAGCEGAALRAHAERIAQGLAPIADAVAAAAAYRTTALVLASATPDPSSAVRRGAVEGAGIGAAGSTRNGAPSRASTAARAVQPSGSSAPARSKPKKKAGTAVTVPARDASSPAKGEQETA